MKKIAVSLLALSIGMGGCASVNAWPRHGAGGSSILACSFDTAGIDDGCDVAVANGFIGQSTYASVTGGAATAASFWTDIRQDNQPGAGYYNSAGVVSAHPAPGNRPGVDYGIGAITASPTNGRDLTTYNFAADPDTAGASCGAYNSTTGTVSGTLAHARNCTLTSTQISGYIVAATGQLHITSGTLPSDTAIAAGTQFVFSGYYGFTLRPYPILADLGGGVYQLGNTPMNAPNAGNAPPDYGSAGAPVTQMAYTTRFRLTKFYIHDSYIYLGGTGYIDYVDNYNANNGYLCAAGTSGFVVTAAYNLAERVYNNTVVNGNNCDPRAGAYQFSNQWRTTTSFTGTITGGTNLTVNTDDPVNPLQIGQYVAVSGQATPTQVVSGTSPNFVLSNTAPNVTSAALTAGPMLGGTGLANAAQGSGANDVQYNFLDGETYIFAANVGTPVMMMHNYTHMIVNPTGHASSFIQLASFQYPGVPQRFGGAVDDGTGTCSGGVYTPSGVPGNVMTLTYVNNFTALPAGYSVGHDAGHTAPYPDHAFTIVSGSGTALCSQYVVSGPPQAFPSASLETDATILGTHINASLSGNTGTINYFLGAGPQVLTVGELVASFNNAGEATQTPATILTVSGTAAAGTQSFTFSGPAQTIASQDMAVGPVYHIPYLVNSNNTIWEDRSSTSGITYGGTSFANGGTFAAQHTYLQGSQTSNQTFFMTTGSAQSFDGQYSSSINSDGHFTVTDYVETANNLIVSNGGSNGWATTTGNPPIGLGTSGESTRFDTQLGGVSIGAQGVSGSISGNVLTITAAPTAGSIRPGMYLAGTGISTSAPPYIASGGCTGQTVGSTCALTTSSTVAAEPLSVSIAPTYPGPAAGAITTVVVKGNYYDATGTNECLFVDNNYVLAVPGDVNQPLTITTASTGIAANIDMLNGEVVSQNSGCYGRNLTAGQH